MGRPIPRKFFGPLSRPVKIININDISDAPSIGLVGEVYQTSDNKFYKWDTVSNGTITFDITVGEGEDYENIQDAIDAAENGQFILVKNGTYEITSTVSINKELTIIGESQENVIIETLGTNSDPVNMFNASVDNVSIARITFNHKKTQNTSVESAVRASGPGFPQTRVDNFLIEECTISYLQHGIELRADNWTARNLKMIYGTGTVSNTHRAFILYGNGGDCFIKDIILDNSVINGTNSRPIYLAATTGSNPNETTSGKLIIDGVTSIGNIAQFYNQDNQQSTGANTFELQIRNVDVNETNLFAGVGAFTENLGDMFSSITLFNNKITNQHAADGGKGLFAVYGTTSFRTTPLVVHASDNEIGQEVFRSGYESVVGALIGKTTNIPEFDVVLDSNIPEVGDIPTLFGSSGEYVLIENPLLEATGDTWSRNGSDPQERDLKNMEKEWNNGYNIPVESVLIKGGSLETSTPGETTPFVLSQRASRRFLIRTESGDGVCVIVDGENPLEEGQAVIVGYLNPTGSPIPLRKIKRRRAYDFSGNSYRWFVAPNDDLQINQIIIVPVN